MPLDVVRLARILRRDKIDILHVNGIMSVQGPLAGKLASVKVLLHLNDTTLPKYFYKTALRAMDLAVDRIVYSSFAVSKHVGRRERTSLDDIMYPPVDGSRFNQQGENERAEEALAEHGLDPHEPVLINVGNVNMVKGQKTLIEAIRILRGRGLKAQALIIGKLVDQKTVDELKSLVSKYQLEDSVKFVGVRSDVERQLRASTVFVFPSLAEAMPIALLEAMACGLPCVATPVGGVPEVIEDGVTGLLFPVNRSDMLAEKLEKLLGDEALRRNLGANARQRVADTFEVESVAAHQAEIYRRLLSGGKIV